MTGLWFVFFCVVVVSIVLHQRILNLSSRAVSLTILVNNNPILGGKMDLKANDALPVSLLVEDKFGNPGAALDAAPAWSLSDASFGAFQASADGMSGQFVPAGKLGQCVLQVAGAIAGQPVTGSLSLNIITGDATQIVLQPGAPVAQYSSMAKSKIFGPQYPVSVEREYLRFLRQYSAYYVKLLREGLGEILPGLRDIAAEEQPRVDSIRMDENIDEKIRRMFKKIDDQLGVRFSEDNLKKVAKQMVSRTNKHTKREVEKMFRSAVPADKELELEPLMSDKQLSPYFQNIVDMNVSLIKSIPEYRKSEFKNELVGLITKDARVEDIAKAIAKYVNRKKGRPEAIARDQVGKLNGALDQYRQQQLGISRYIWRTSEDARVRKDHKRLDGKTFFWSRPPLIDSRTGSHGHPKEDFGCRCWAEPVFDDVL